jgi:hypothetical protein
MRNIEKCVSWVVYRMTIYGKPSETNSVCEQHEWEAMERAQPGLHTLVQACIPSESEAERLARGTPEPEKPRKPSRWKTIERRIAG